MVVEEIVVGSSEVVSESVLALGKLGLLLQALGIVVILNVLFQIIGLIYTRKMNNRLRRIEKKLKIK